MRNLEIPPTRSSHPQQVGFRVLIIILLVLGVFFRFFNLDHKVYWHDEVYTSMRAAGFMRYEIDQELFQNRIIPAEELQKFQRLKPRSRARDTIRSLAVEDPQHPPLYFLMARLWMEVFGSSLTASRTLPVLLSLLGLPFMYGLALELFASRSAALLATAFLALSPFDLLFAQTARQYSLLTTAVIASSFLLLRALRLPRGTNWGLYTIATAIGFYTHPFFGLTLIGHVAFVVGYWGLVQKFGKLDGKGGLDQSVNLQTPELYRTKNSSKSQFPILEFFLAAAAALILYSPWLVVLKTNYQRMMDTTDWARFSVGFLYLVKLWILSFTSLFLDLDFGFDSIWTYLLRGLVAVVIGVAIYTVYRQTSWSTKLFILTSIFVPFLLLALPDLLGGGKRSAVSRYLISSYPGIQLAVAYLVATHLSAGKQVWRGVLALLLTGSVVSCTVSALADTWWSKDLSYANAEIARQINAKPSPLVVSEIGDDFTNTGDLISLSYLLNDDVRLLLLSQPPKLNLIPKDVQPLVFRPSGKFFQAVQKEKAQLVEVAPYTKLWRLERK